MVVDDDLIVLKSAGQILSRNHMRVTGFQSGTRCSGTWRRTDFRI